MKVSKKVGRRKCASSVSVSRRRLRNKNKKSSYRKKHTQRGGKRGKCTRTRGYKRGRRFHRGGEPPIYKPDGTIASSLYLEDSDGNEYATDTSPSKSYSLTYYQSGDFSNRKLASFNCKVKYYMKDDTLMVKVLFKGPFQFEFDGIALDIFSKLTEKDYGMYRVRSTTDKSKEYLVNDTENNLKTIGLRIKKLSESAEVLLKSSLEVQGKTTAYEASSGVGPLGKPNQLRPEENHDDDDDEDDDEDPVMPPKIIKLTAAAAASDGD